MVQAGALLHPPERLQANVVNSVFEFDEEVGSVLEASIGKFQGMPTIAVRVQVPFRMNPKGQGREDTWITMTHGTERYATIIEQSLPAPKPTTHTPVALGGTQQLPVAPQLGGTCIEQQPVGVYAKA